VADLQHAPAQLGECGERAGAGDAVGDGLLNQDMDARIEQVPRDAEVLRRRYDDARGIDLADQGAVIRQCACAELLGSPLCPRLIAVDDKDQLARWVAARCLAWNWPKYPAPTTAVRIADDIDVHVPTVSDSPPLQNVSPARNRDAREMGPLSTIVGCAWPKCISTDHRTTIRAHVGGISRLGGPVGPPRRFKVHTWGLGDL
jgi:hypothetical protein